MFAGDFYPTHVDSLNETTGFKSNNQPKIYTSYKRALVGAMAVIKRSTFAVQILPVQEAGIIIGCPFRFSVEWKGSRRRVHRLYDIHGKRIPYN